MIFAELDHIIVYAASLDEGRAWAQEVLGVDAPTGGSHFLMGTHNLIIRMDSDVFPKAYLEIIAIDPVASHPAVGGIRWFDMDCATLSHQIAKSPRLIHWVARTNQLQEAVDELRRLGIDRGDILSASRASSHGLLEWQMTVRSDGWRLMNGALPTLIQWGDLHPVDSMPISPLKLKNIILHVTTEEELALLEGVLAKLHLAGVGTPLIRVEILHTHGLSVDIESPRGLVRLRGYD